MTGTQSSGGLAIVVLVACLANRAYAEERAVPRVRSSTPQIISLLARAAEGSATFRRELATIHASDGLVYIEEGVCGHTVSACLTMTVTTAGPYRVLWVSVNLRRSDRDVMAAIGHELQHAIEVLSDPHVTDSQGLASFFEREGPTTRGDTFETPAAVKAGAMVYDELRRRK
jgi:hypothetical protein